MNLKTYSEAWLKAVNDKESSMMQDALSDEFVWSNDRFNWNTNKKETISWCLDTNFTAVDFSCYYENEEVIVGTHNVIEPGAPDSSVMFIAKIKDNKVVSHQHLREFDR
ncbi:MAG: hypothetical protein QGF84_07945 [Candidatus Thioglobus sp.]|jgi:hypothetical protein|nr:hypothetical protein [Candidatus Thioglobus sp.]